MNDAENRRLRAVERDQAEARRAVDLVALAHLLDLGTREDGQARPLRVLIARCPSVDPTYWNQGNLLPGEGRVGVLDRVARKVGEDGGPRAWVVGLSPPPLRLCLGNGVSSLWVSPRNLLPVRTRGESLPAS